MALVQLASVGDLADRGVDTSNASLVGAMLGAASEAVREAAGAAISVTTSTVEVEGTQGQRLPLPGGPLRSVSSVKVDGVEVSDFRVVGGALWRRVGWSSYCDEPSIVTVTYQHGFDEVPADVVDLVCQFAAAGIASAAEGYAGHAGVASEQEAVDDWSRSRTFVTGGDAQASVMEVPPRTRLMLRSRFGGGTYVTGGSQWAG